jgi:hypothetical protein
MSFPQFVLAASAIVIATMIGTLFVRQRVAAAVIAVAGAMAVTSVNAAGYLRHYSDDAYITLRYARYFAAGQGPVWNPGERVEGYTDFLWMALIAGMHRLGADLVDASVWLSYASMLAVFVIAWRIWALWAAEEGGALARPAVLAVTLLLIALNDSLVFWGFSGLETGMAAALLTLTVYLFMREARGARVPWSALAATAAAMTRPEMMLVAAVTGGCTLRDAAERRDAASIRRLALWSVMFVVTYGAYFAWRYSYYGHVFPNTYYAKVGSGGDFINRGMGYVQAYGLSYLFLPFVMGAAALVFAGTKGIRRDAQYVLAVVAAWAFAVIMEGGDAFAHGRFLAPVVPVMYVAGVSGLTVVLARAIPQPRQLAAAGLLTAMLAGLALSRGSADPTVPADRHARDEREALGRWLHDHVPAGYTVAVYASGAVPYYAQTRALDLLGLTDETIAHSTVPDFGKGIAGHEKYNIPYTLTVVRPELIMLGDTAPFVMPKTTILRLRGGLPAYNALIDDPQTFELYEASAIKYQGRWFNFLQRKDVVGKVAADWTESGGYVER